jgi:hypothetical protein
MVKMTSSSTSHLSHTQKLEQSDMLPQGHHHTPLKYVLCPPPLGRTSSQGRPSLSFILTSFTSSWRSVRDWRKQSELVWRRRIFKEEEEGVWRMKVALARRSALYLLPLSNSTSR